MNFRSSNKQYLVEIIKNQPGEIGRREFTEVCFRYLLGFAGILSEGAVATAQDIKPTIDLSHILNQPATKNSNRKSPPLHRNADWLQHYRRPFDNTAGIDYAPIGTQTEIVPIARGAVFRVSDNPTGGHFVAVHHGMGFYSWYLHLQESFVKEGDIVERGTSVLALMGATGGGVRYGKHLHLNLTGPAYIPYLKLNNVQYVEGEPIWGENIDREKRLINVIDAEEFSILGRHKHLPYLSPEDSELDRQFSLFLEKARKDIDEYLRLFSHIKPHSPKYFKYVRKREGVSDIALHRDTKNLYEAVSKETPSMPKSEADKIKNDIEEIMITAIPRFTAPIRPQ